MATRANTSFGARGGTTSSGNSSLAGDVESVYAEAFWTSHADCIRHGMDMWRTMPRERGSERCSHVCMQQGACTSSRLREPCIRVYCLSACCVMLCFIVHLQTCFHLEFLDGENEKADKSMTRSHCRMSRFPEKNNTVQRSAQPVIHTLAKMPLFCICLNQNTACTEKPPPKSPFT